MGRQDIDIHVETRADPATVYALLRDGASWPTWSPIGSFELEEAARDEPEGVGAIRVFRTDRSTGPVTTRERIVELVPERRLSYVLLSGMPIRDYRADIDLTPNGSGTSIHWHSSFTARVPGTGWLFRRILHPFIQQTVHGLATHAATRTAGGSSRRS